MAGFLKLEDFGDLEEYKDLSPFDVLAVVCAKAVEKEEQLNPNNNPPLSVSQQQENKPSSPETSTVATTAIINEPPQNTNNNSSHLPLSSLPSSSTSNNDHNRQPPRGRTSTRIRPPSPPPSEIPDKFRQKIKELNGEEPKFVFKKVLYKTDLEKGQARLTMPMSKCTLCEDELSKIPDDTAVLVIQPNDDELTTKKLTFKVWQSTLCYVLNNGWYDFHTTIKTQTPLKPEECLFVYYFKIKSPNFPSHGFALVRSNMFN